MISTVCLLSEPVNTEDLYEKYIQKPFHEFNIISTIVKL